MKSAYEESAHNRRIMVYTAAAMYGAAGLDGCIEGFLPGDPPFAVLPVILVLVMFATLLVVGRYIPRRWLALLGPLGVCLVGFAVATTPWPSSDTAVLYALPVVWTSLFFGRRGAAMIVACVAGAHTLALLLMATGAYPGRWVDVMVAATTIAVTVRALVERNETLVRRLAAEARTDELTRLLNRRGFNEQASLVIAHARREHAPLALVAFDIDHFKRINDESGHELGDRVLARIGELLAAQARDVDVVARLGGEEFAALLRDTDGDGAEAFAERLRAGLAASHFGTRSAVTISAGVASHDGAVEIGDLLRSADLALYEAKHAGRDRVIVFEDQALAA